MNPFVRRNTKPATMKKSTMRGKYNENNFQSSIIKYMFLSAISTIFMVVNAANTPPYANVTLTSPDGDLSVVVFLPSGIKPNEKSFYTASRFDHGSMIGQIRLKNSKQQNQQQQRNFRKSQSQPDYTEIYGSELWRNNDYPPYNNHHNPQDPESGFGLASEFGVGVDGAFCHYRCGWDGVDDITNGLLGYQNAKDGESFLKIGVGKLIKGSCPSCDSTNDYRFNSPYQFAEQPRWDLVESKPNSIVMQHDAYLEQSGQSNTNIDSILSNMNININQNTYAKQHFGYSLRKDISVHKGYLLVTTTLANVGNRPFTTVWYSHHFFTCDDEDVSNDYSITLGINATNIRKNNIDGSNEFYEEPGVFDQWATPLINYADVKADKKNGKTTIKIKKRIDGVRIKTEFMKDDTSDGAFTIHACGLSVREDIPQIRKGSTTTKPNSPDSSSFITDQQQQYNGDISMYAYNLYIEKGTLSPEPQILIHLEGGESKSWTQRITITEESNKKTKKNESPPKSSESSELFSHPATGLLASITSKGSFNSENASIDTWQQVLTGTKVVLVSVLALIAVFTIQRSLQQNSQFIRRSQYSVIPENENRCKDISNNNENTYE